MWRILFSTFIKRSHILILQESETKRSAHFIVQWPVFKCDFVSHIFAFHIKIYRMQGFIFSTGENIQSIEQSRFIFWKSFFSPLCFWDVSFYTFGKDYERVLCHSPELQLLMAGKIAMEYAGCNWLGPVYPWRRICPRIFVDEEFIFFNFFCETPLFPANKLTISSDVPMNLFCNKMTFFLQSLSALSCKVLTNLEATFIYLLIYS